MVNQSEKVGAAASVTTRYTFVGLANQVAAEEEKDSTGTWKVSKSYAYGAGGENLSLLDTPVNTGTSKKSFYGTNPHGDVETLTDASTGTTTSTYRYTAYGQPDKTGTTGDDAIMDDAAKDADMVNPYRFNSSRFDGATGTYDMGFREYNPGLNRFLTRDMFNGALTDLGLGTDPWNANRYMFGGGNPISRVELNGHMNADNGEGGGGFVLGPVLEKCPDCQLRIGKDGSWTFDGYGDGDVTKGPLNVAGDVSDYVAGPLIAGPQFVSSWASRASKMMKSSEFKAVRQMGSKYLNSLRGNVCATLAAGRRRPQRPSLADVSGSRELLSALPTIEPTGIAFWQRSPRRQSKELWRLLGRR